MLTLSIYTNSAWIGTKCSHTLSSSTLECGLLTLLQAAASSQGQLPFHFSHSAKRGKARRELMFLSLCCTFVIWSLEVRWSVDESQKTPYGGSSLSYFSFFC